MFQRITRFSADINAFMLARGWLPGGGTYDSNQCLMMGIAWSKSMLEYIEIASNVTNFAVGGSSNWEILVLNDTLSLTHQGISGISFWNSQWSHLLMASIAVPHFATIGRSWTGFLCTLAVALNNATLSPWICFEWRIKVRMFFGRKSPNLSRKWLKSWLMSWMVDCISSVMFW